MQKHQSPKKRVKYGMSSLPLRRRLPLLQVSTSTNSSLSSHSSSSSSSSSNRKIIMTTMMMIMMMMMINICFFFKSGFTGYVRQVNGNRKSHHGSNHYFDLYLQISKDKNQMIRVMTTGMNDTTKN